MKKTFLFLFIFCMSASSAFADGRSDNPAGVRPFEAMGRGFLNIVGFPAEIVSTGIREVEMHPRLWPVTYLPRLATNLIIRAFSGVNDIVFVPIYAPFTDDLSPTTEAMGLPTYPWQV